ncbi:MAG: sialate O-acetylesterase [Luteolibacter sp.]
MKFGSRSMEAKADNQGAWRMLLPAMEASTEGKMMEISSGKDRLQLVDILVGKVWLFSGQSNMDFALSRAIGGREEVASAGGNPLLRVCNLSAPSTDGKPYDEGTLARLNEKALFVGSWETASPSSAAPVSAIAWWVGKGIQLKSAVPVGIVENAVGGSGTEAWLPRDILAAKAEYRALLGDDWAKDPHISGWSKGRVKLNLGGAHTVNHPFRPGMLFESGVRDWSGFPFEAVIWYQGETNAESPDDAWNAGLIRDLINGWRQVLGNRDLPFVMVQLPRIGGNDPLRRYWPQYREVQSRVAKEMPGVSLVVTSDLGWDSPDVHPPDKRPVADRILQELSKPVWKTNR